MLAMESDNQKDFEWSKKLCCLLERRGQALSAHSDWRISLICIVYSHDSAIGARWTEPT